MFSLLQSEIPRHFYYPQVTQVLEEAQKIESVEWIFYEGGEPFLFFPLLNESIKRAGAKGFKVGVVTNAYGAHSKEDAELWLRPLAESGLTYLNISNDNFHYGDESINPASIATSAARKLGIETSPICIEPPRVLQADASEKDKGRPVVGGGARFRGRAVEKLSDNLPLRPWDELCECPYEDLESPSRVHVDPYGNVQICQGISMGNMWKTPLSKIVSQYRSGSHPICSPLLRGGPATLLRELGLSHETGYIDECHFCYLIRRSLIDQFPDILAPRQVYNLK